MINKKMNFNIWFATLTIFILSNNNISQIYKSESPHIFENIVNYKNINFKLSVDKLTSCDTEDIKFNIKITNSSLNRVAIFKELDLKPFGIDTIKGIFINLGGMDYLNSGLEFPIILKIIEPDSSYFISANLSKDSFKNKIFNDCLYSIFHIGLIDSLDKINSITRWEGIKTRYLSNNFVELNSYLILEIISIFDFKSFNFRIYNCNN